jgi:ABC-type glutathione transport system ATPase component
VRTIADRVVKIRDGRIVPDTVPASLATRVTTRHKTRKTPKTPQETAR